MLISRWLHGAVTVSKTCLLNHVQPQAVFHASKCCPEKSLSHEMLQFEQQFCSMPSDAGSPQAVFKHQKTDLHSACCSPSKGAGQSRQYSRNRKPSPPHPCRHTSRAYICPAMLASCQSGVDVSAHAGKQAASVRSVTLHCSVHTIAGI